MQSSKEAELKPEKFDFINGIRGIAAIQVVLLHYCAFFLPALARVQPKGHFPWEDKLTNTPLYFLIDGQNAVSLFFIMSGFVLTPAFANAKSSIQNSISKRFIRLFLPVVASVILAMALIALLGGEHTSAAAVTGSEWGSALIALTPSLPQMTREIFLNSMLVGYQSVSFLSVIPGINEHLTSVIKSPNSPMWTLHIELWGSMLILATALMHKHFKSIIFWPLFLAIILFLGSSRYNLFLVGFIFYLHRNVFLISSSKLRNLLGLAFIACGIAVSVLTSTFLADMALSAFKTITFTNQDTSAELKTEITALLIFTGIMLSSPIKRLMEAPIAQVAGRLSFSIYLIHFPILFTITAFLFNHSVNRLGYLPSVGVSSVCGLAVTFGMATLFDRFVDLKSISLSRRLTTSSKNKTSRNAVI
jgi:peptidoglycan/LPS O-acetylase OafA/YrhL